MVATWDEGLLGRHSCRARGGSRRGDFCVDSGGRSKISGQELTEAEEKLHKVLASAARGRELRAWKKFNAPEPVEEGALSNSVVDTR